MFELPYKPLIGEHQNKVILKYMDNFKTIETKLNELENKKEAPQCLYQGRNIER